MDIETIEDRLKEIKEFEDGGLILDSTGPIILGAIARNTGKYFRKLSDNLGEQSDQVLEDILAFTRTAYVTFFDVDFIEEKPDRSKKYRPILFMGAVRDLSLEMSDADSVRKLYDALTTNIKHSSRFIYHLVVRDLSKAIEEANERPDISKKNFTEFALQVLDQSGNYPGVEDKWGYFKNRYDSIKARFFPEIIKEEVVAEPKKETINAKYILELIKKGSIRDDNGTVKSPVEIFTGEVDSLVGVIFGGKRDARMARIELYTGDPYNPTRTAVDIEKGTRGAPEFFLSISDIALKNLGAANYTGDLFTRTSRSKTSIINYL